MKSNFKGFTLVELMVALALGLIIVAAAVQLLISGQSTLTYQKAMESVQDNANFGMNYITADIRQTNLDVGGRKMGNSTLSGLIVKKENYPSGITTTDLALSSTATGLTLADKKSDVLVIQYKPALLNGFDCEGKKITSAKSMIVQKYFIRKDQNNKNGDLVLACAAGRYEIGIDKPALEDLTSTSLGQVVLQRADQFKVLVGVVDSANKMSYLTLDQYVAAANTIRPVTLQIGVLIRSVDNAGNNTVIPSSYTLLNTTYKVSNPQNITGKFLRIPLEQTVAIRNAIGDTK
ncbi:prepilin-type N-terminal cleavage/methylation domain-containing protein [Acinetobacter guillouiae]|uniref:prepilin-type N-terminal cleavage/methylation domain-containing protein n=1 Tax=Acinetobacter guillouiae TaxID=106649 RepID=UPI003AF7F45B